MRILFFTQVLPYPIDAGPKIRAYYTLRHLARQHDITLVSFVRHTDSAKSVEHLRTFCSAVYTLPMRRSRWGEARHFVNSLVTDNPFLIIRDRVPDMRSLVRSLIVHSSGFDAIHADQLWMAPYALFARDSVGAKPGPVTVLDQHNAVFRIPGRLAQHERNPLKRAVLRLEEHKLARYEAAVCRRFDHVVWVSQEDQTAVRRRMHRPSARWTTIPICVDPATHQRIEIRPGARRVTFVGGLHWPPNAEGIGWFARDVWPRVRQQVPEAVLTIIGKDPARTLREAATSGEGIHVTGYLADPGPLLAETAVFVVPLRAGGGMRVKILDAWCWGLPVVSTCLGAEGITVRDGQQALIADDAAAFSDAVIRVLRHPEIGAKLASAARQAVETQYNWRERYSDWDRIYA